MSGINFSITVNDLDVRTALNELLRRGESLRPAFMEIGQRLIESHEDRFPAQKSPDGSPWAPLSEKYKKSKRKRESRHPDLILVLNKYLASNWRHQASDNELEFGTDRIYAAVHQFGNTTMNIPARPFLGVSEADEEEIVAILTEHLLPH